MDKLKIRLLVGAVGLIVLVAVGITIYIICCGGECKVATGAAAWEDVLKKCAQNETFRPDHMVYLGPSNNTGVGTIWQRADGGGYVLKRLPPTLPPETFKEGTWSSCGGTSSCKFSVSSGIEGVVLSRVKRVAGGSGGLAADLARAKTVSLKVGEWRETQLVEDAFGDWFGKLPENDPYRLSMLKLNRVVAYRVVEVKGMTATLTFDDAAKSQLSGKLGPEGKADGSAELKTEWKGNNTLEITVPEVFVIEAEFGTYTSTGDFKGGGITPSESDKEAPVTEDREDT